MSLVRSSFSLNNQIGKFAGRIVYHLSASNWMAVFHRMRTRVHFLSSTSEDRPDTVDLQLMNHCAMDRARLVQVLHGMSSCTYSLAQTIHITNHFRSSLIITCQHEAGCTG
jgi:neurofibromin 1